MSKRNKNKKSKVQVASEKIFGKWTKWWGGGEYDYTDYERDDGYRSSPIGGGPREENLDAPTYKKEYKKDWTTSKESESWSYSSQWQSRVGYTGVGYWASSWDSGNKERAKLHDWASQLARTANITLNSTDSDRPLYIQWASKGGGQYNSPSSNTIYLSPDALLNASSDEAGMVLDGMIGQVLMASTMKTTMSQRTWEEGIVIAPAGRNIWMALELSAARKNLMINWEGFLPYLIRHSDMTSPDKKDIEADMAVFPKGLQAITNVLAWNIAHPENTIEPRAEWVEAMDEAEDLLELAKKEDRASVGKEIAERLKVAFNGDDTARGGDKTISDGSLFGETVLSQQELKNIPGRVDIRKFNSQNVQLPDGVYPLTNDTLVEFHESMDAYGYKEIANRYASAIKSIVNALRFRANDRTYYSYGHKSGDLDSGALHKLTLNEDDPAIWERKDMIGTPRIAVGILIDESGSMREGTKMQDTIDVAIIMTEAFRQLRNMDLMVLGHSANGHARESVPHRTIKRTNYIPDPYNSGHCCNNMRVAEYFTKRHKTPYAMQFAEANGNNLDGFAMEHAARKMAKDYPEAAIKVLFLISDGRPAGVTAGPYEAPGSYKHMKQVSMFAKTQLKVNIYGIGVCEAYSDEVGEKMYGAGRFVVLGDVMGSIPVLTSFIAQIARKA